MASSNDKPSCDSDECSSFESFEDESNNSTGDSQSSHLESDGSSHDYSDYSRDSDDDASSSENSKDRSDFGSSGSPDDEYEVNHEQSNPWTSGVARIRNRFSSAIRTEIVDSSSCDETDYQSSSAAKKKNDRPSKYFPRQSGIYYVKKIYSHITKRSTAILFISIVIWLYVQYQFIIVNDRMAAVVPSVTPPPPTVQSLSDLAANLAAYKIQRAKDALKALGTGAGNNNEQHKVKSRHNKRRKAVEVDKMPNGCTPTSWQMLSFPNCNDIHEIDLKHSLGMTRKEGVRIPADLGDGDKSGHFWSEEDKRVSKKMGFVGSGLWRQVWKVDTRNESGGEDDRSVVLKVMKLEHNVDVRNFDRHRRDALAMERLTSSKNVVSIYSFCGNTVLTEYAGITLEDLILSPVKVDNEEVPMEEGIVNNNTTHSTHSIYSTDTAEGRIQLALEVMRGLAAIHDIPDGPIMHADIQAKQFLFDPVKGVKINDFNRCRFVPRNNETGLPCKLNIPSAPGGNRSPEEYEHSYLDEKIDMYSSANILFAILTGKRAWEEASRGDVAKKVMKGFRPSINEKYRKPGTYDAALADIIDNAYEAHPDERWSAKQVIEKLERILSKGVGGKDREENKIKSSLRRR